MTGKHYPWWQPETTGQELELISDVLTSNYLNEGEVTVCFENKLASMLGADFAISVTSGTAALYLSLVALGVGPGDEVIVPDITFIATANAVTMAGAKVVLVDVDRRTLNMDAASLDKAITAKTKAVIPVHVSGRPAAMDDLMRICNDRGLPLIEDAAEALCSQYRGRYLGTIGLAGCFSFSAAKTITTGQGGVIITDDAKLAARLRELKDQGRARRGTGGDDSHPVIGFNFKFTNLQAAVGLGQLQDLPRRLASMRRIYSIYKDELEGVEGIELLSFDIEAGEQPQWVDAMAERRNDLDAFLSAHGADCRRFWFPLHTQTPYARSSFEFPNSSESGKKAIWLPSAFQLSDDDVRTVSALIRKFYQS